MILSFTNNIDKNTFELSVNDFGDSRIYLHFRVTVPAGYADGEYNAELWDDEKENCYWTGIIQIGDYKQENKKYIKESNGNKQYNPNN